MAWRCGPCVPSNHTSFVALPDGTLAGETPPGVPAVTVVDVPCGTGRSLFLRRGDAFAWLLIAVLAVALLSPAGSRAPR